MNDTARLEISVLAAALVLGISGDALLRSFPWGLNFTLWLGALAVAIVILGRARREVFAGGGYWLALPMALFSLSFLWHDSLALEALNLLAVLTALSLFMLRAQGGRLRVGSLAQYALSSVIAALNAMFGMFILLFGNREWKKPLPGVKFRTAVAVLCGMAFSIPPLLVFGSLFMGADPVFRSLTFRFLRISPLHLVVTVMIAFGVGGYLRGLLFGKEINPESVPVRPPWSLNTIEMGIVLGVMDLLFLAFVVVQIRYFFGGSGLVLATTGLTYSEYARSGFFQLVAVAALLLPFLLFLHWLLPPENAPAQRLYRYLSGTLIVLLFVVMASAWQRMRLYVSEYGLSEQRLYPTAFMIWLAVVSVWFALTVLRGDRRRFAFGAMVAGFLLIAVLQLLNPDALIARTNLARLRAGRTFDARYLARLSADVVPELVANLAVLNSQDRCTVATTMLDRWSPPANADWRTWNRARALAWQAVQSNTPALRAAACSETRK